MSKLIFIFSLLFILNTNSEAQTVQKLIVKKGITIKPSFDGYLLSNEALAKIISETETTNKLLLLEINKLKEEIKLIKSNEQTICKLKLDTSLVKYHELINLKKVEKQLYQQMISDSKPKWYESPYVVWPTSIILSAVTTLSIYYVTN